MYEITKLLSRDVFDELIKILPNPRQKRYGRKRCGFEAILNGVLQVLVNDVSWMKIAPCGASYVSCYRYFKEIQRRGKLKLIFEVLVKAKTNVIESAIDSNSVSSFRFSRMTGWCGKHKKISTKISLLTDINGLPADVSVNKGGVDDRDFVPIHLQNGGYRRRIKSLNLDKGYTSADIRRNLRKRGIHVNMQIKSGDYIRKRGSKLRFYEDKYKTRFLIEKVFAWMENFRHIKLRREYKPAMYKAFVYLSLILILLRN